MKDHPMLFSAPMIQALLREIENPGTGKTQTRRLPKIKGRPGFFDFGKSDTKGYDWTYRRKDHVWEDLRHDELLKRLPIAIGDRIWVKETYCLCKQMDAIKPSECSKYEPVGYLADGMIREMSCHMIAQGKTRVSMHMPRWASRITLEVTDVRVERLQDISGDDCMAEGVIEAREIVDITSNGAGIPTEVYDDRFRVPGIDDDEEGHLTEHDAFIDLWNHVNGPDAWDQNPWVVAYTFKPFLCNIDQMEKAA